MCHIAVCPMRDTQSDDQFGVAYVYRLAMLVMSQKIVLGESKSRLSTQTFATPSRSNGRYSELLVCYCSSIVSIWTELILSLISLSIIICSPRSFIFPFLKSWVEK